MQTDLEPCLHCKLRRGGGWMRGLCEKCWTDKTIRAKYPKRRYGPMPGLDSSKLTPTIPEYCRHGKKDGTCPVCEREQRAEMAIQCEEQDDGARVDI